MAGAAVLAVWRVRQHWLKEKQLFQAIDATIQARPYRAKAYRKRRSGWAHVDEEEYDRAAYERLVAKEWPQPTSATGVSKAPANKRSRR